MGLAALFTAFLTSNETSVIYNGLFGLSPDGLLVVIEWIEDYRVKHKV